MSRAAIAAPTVFEDVSPLLRSVRRSKRMVFALLLSGLSICLPARGHTAGLDCPETALGAVPNLLTDVQLKPVMSGNSVDLANAINDLINKLQIEKPNSNNSPPTRWPRERSLSPTFHCRRLSTESSGARPQKSIKLRRN